MHGLLADAEEERDLLPRPAVLAGVADLKRLQPFRKLAQLACRLQAGRRVRAAGRLGESHSMAHCRQYKLTKRLVSTVVDAAGAGWGCCHCYLARMGLSGRRSGGGESG